MTGTRRGGRARYLESLVEAGSAIALPEFTRGQWPEALHRIRNRHGVGVMALPSAALTAEQELALLRFRFAQYLAVGFIDSEIAYRERLEHEPLVDPEPETVNCVAFSSCDGRVLAYLALRAPAAAPIGTTLRTRERPLLPLEEHFGWGALNRLQLLPDVPLDRIRELGRFVKNQRLGRGDELGTRGVLEVCVAGFNALTGPLRTGVDAFVGEFEDVVARRHLEFLHAPFVMLRGGLPAFPGDHFLRPALDRRARYPFAGWVSDLTAITQRLEAIEAALAAPGARALAALAELSAIAPEVPPSSLVPADGVPRLADTALPQRALSLPDRLRARGAGAGLRRFAPFAGLSDTEATTLYPHLDDLTLARGAHVVRRGERSDSVYLIEGGHADVGCPGSRPTARLSPGDLFGEIGLLTGQPRTADVVARSRLRVLGLSRETYRRYLAALPDVAGELHRTALVRAAALGSGSAS